MEREQNNMFKIPDERQVVKLEKIAFMRPAAEQPRHLLACSLLYVVTVTVMFLAYSFGENKILEDLERVPLGENI